MDRNTLIGLVLIFVIIGGSVFLMKPSEEEIKKERERQAARANVEQTITSSSDSTKLVSDSLALAQLALQDSARLAGPFGTALSGQEQLYTIENELLKVSISSKGGRVKSVELKNETTYDGEPLMLFEGDHNKFGLFFNAAGKNISTNDLYFQSESPLSTTVLENDSASVTLRLLYSDNQYIDYVYSLKADSYELGFTIVTKGMQDAIA